MLTEGELLRFWPKVGWPDVGAREVDECWPWTGARHSRGYGAFWRERGAMCNAHRVMWEAAHGEIPDGLCVLHTCDNRVCCNPVHLFLGTRRDNAADRERKGRGNQVRGERNGRAKLNREQVLEIRALVAEGETRRVAGRCFGVSQGTVGDIVHRRSWAWLEGVAGG